MSHTEDVMGGGGGVKAEQRQPNGVSEVNRRDRSHSVKTTQSETRKQNANASTNSTANTMPDTKIDANKATELWMQWNTAAEQG